MDGILKVTPSELRRKSTEFDSVRAQVMSLIDQMTSKVNALSSVWQGEASTTYLQSYAGLSDDIARLNRMIAEHVSDLNQMADIYATAETSVDSLNAALPKDAIQ